jgi:hypothetical protein
MSEAVRKLLDEIDQLPAEDRALLRAELRVSDEFLGTPQEIAQAWQHELYQGLREVRDGTAQLDDWDDVEQELSRLVGK